MQALSDPVQLSLLDLLGSTALADLLGESQTVGLRIPYEYLADGRLLSAGREGLAIQRLLTLAQRGLRLTFIWDPNAARRVLESPAVHPLAALTTCLNDVHHRLEDDGTVDMVPLVERARSRLLGHRLSADMFSERQILLCVDHNRPSLPFDFYVKGRLRSDEEFEALVDDVIRSQLPPGTDPGRAALTIQRDFVYLDTAGGKRDSISQADILAVVLNALCCTRFGNRPLVVERGVAPMAPIQWSQSVYGQVLLSPANFRDYNDAILKAAFLRAAHRSELMYFADERTSEDMVQIITAELAAWAAGGGDALPEMLMALASGRSG